MNKSKNKNGLMNYSKRKRKSGIHRQKLLFSRCKTQAISWAVTTSCRPFKMGFILLTFTGTSLTLILQPLNVHTVQMQQKTKTTKKRKQTQTLRSVGKLLSSSAEAGVLLLRSNTCCKEHLLREKKQNMDAVR